MLNNIITHCIRIVKKYQAIASENLRLKHPDFLLNLLTFLKSLFLENPLYFNHFASFFPDFLVFYQNCLTFVKENDTIRTYA